MRRRGGSWGGKRMRFEDPRATALDVPACIPPAPPPLPPLPHQTRRHLLPHPSIFARRSSPSRCRAPPSWCREPPKDCRRSGGRHAGVRDRLGLSAVANGVLSCCSVPAGFDQNWDLSYDLFRWRTTSSSLHLAAHDLRRGFPHQSQLFLCTLIGFLLRLIISQTQVVRAHRRPVCTAPASLSLSFSLSRSLSLSFS